MTDQRDFSVNSVPSVAYSGDTTVSDAWTEAIIVIQLVVRGSPSRCALVSRLRTRICRLGENSALVERRFLGRKLPRNDRREDTNPFDRLSAQGIADSIFCANSNL
jgi:hypothetical protein